MRVRREIAHPSQELVAGAFLLTHEVENAPGGPVGFCPILSDVVQSAPNIECSSHNVDVMW
ncbi:hypothetical protein J2Z31_002189 [Sinorhizobium kostiense]|uniref:Uncharacterized protein n=1 Tax=Sinorhizobium kostiense TaxID=76747 RepID=A0ABS4R1I5_9HYPH|nr:hypothetical protein [Sinorhizobium kostiense]